LAQRAEAPRTPPCYPDCSWGVCRPDGTRPLLTFGLRLPELVQSPCVTSQERNPVTHIAGVGNDCMGLRHKPSRREEVCGEVKSAVEIFRFMNDRRIGRHG